MATAAQALRQFKRASTRRTPRKLELYPTFLTAVGVGFRAAQGNTPSRLSLQFGRDTGARC
jgi:hypothetical protein